MKLRLIALASVCTLPLSLFPLFAALSADEPNQPCKAYLDTTKGTDAEANNCPITVGDFSIRGTFSNSNWQASFWAWEPSYYILYVKNNEGGRKLNLTGFTVRGTTSRPQYQFTDPDRGMTYVVTFRYSDPDTIRLEIYQNNRVIVNELLVRESDRLLGRP